jgi:alkanesulfonate monooxygenase SsuD/methylene tetrahydromethanopterin reductase-like flavin-dependent oxidoreductase (luciferase family)
MRIGAHFLAEDLPTFVESVKRAETSGYDRAWLAEGQMLWQDVYVYLTHALAATDVIVCGPAITNPVTRHYSVTASAIATLANLHPGRVVLGIGRGDNAVRTMGLVPASSKELAEIVPRLRDLTAGRPIDIGDSRFRIRWANEDVPLMMAATGPKTLRLAGALADIVMIQVGVQPAAVGWAIGHIRAGAGEAGRDPESVEVSVVCGMWVSDDLREARDKCRWAPTVGTNQLEFVARGNPDHDMPDELTRILRVKRDAYDYYAGHLDSSAEHNEYLSDDLIDAFAIAGPAERCLETIRELRDLGVGEISSAYLNGELEQLARVGREIVPAIRPSEPAVRGVAAHANTSTERRPG